MSGRVYDTARAPYAPRFCMVQGLTARRLGKGLSANPYPKGSPEWRCWRQGHSPVSRETVSRPGNDERGDRWPAADEALLAFAAGDLDGATLAAMVGVSHQALRCKLARMRKAQAERGAA